MDKSDISLEFGLEALVLDDRCKPVAALPSFGWVPVRDAAAAVRFVSPVVPVAALLLPAVFAGILAAEFTLLLDGALIGFAVTLMATVVFAGLPATGARIDFVEAGGLAVLLFDAAAAFTILLLTLLTAALLVADLVTVAFMVCLHY